MEVLGRFTGGGQVSGLGDLAIAPGAHVFEFADCTIEDEFSDTREVFDGVSLGTNLSGEFVFVFQICGADDARFFNGIGEGFFAINMFAAIHRPVRDERVGVIGGAANDSVEVFLVEAFSPINVVLCLRKFFGGESQVFLVDVAECSDIFTGYPAVMRLTASPGANEGEVKFVAGGIGPEQLSARKNQRGGSGEGGGFQECTTVHRTGKFGFNGAVAMVGWWSGEGYSVKKEEGKLLDQ